MAFRKVLLMLDWYSKAVFTVIALALSMIALRGYNASTHAQAYGSLCGASPETPCYMTIQTGKYAIDVKVKQ
ncbi:MAG: hypothetical protein WCD20_10755 [Rhodomicrobium sp.]